METPCKPPIPSCFPPSPRKLRQCTTRRRALLVCWNLQLPAYFPTPNFSLCGGHDGHSNDPASQYLDYEGLKLAIEECGETAFMERLEAEQNKVEQFIKGQIAQLVNTLRCVRPREPLLHRSLSYSSCPVLASGVPTVRIICCK